MLHPLWGSLKPTQTCDCAVSLGGGLAPPGHPGLSSTGVCPGTQSSRGATGTIQRASAASVAPLIDPGGDAGSKTGNIGRLDSDLWLNSTLYWLALSLGGGPCAEVSPSRGPITGGKSKLQKPKIHKSKTHSS
eukprot:EG_transcript_14647